MIYAEFGMDADKRQIYMNLKGHANSAEVGKDLICASASILAYTLAQNITYARARGLLKYEPTIRLKDGDAKVVCRARNNDGLKELGTIFCTIQTGFQLLAFNYPNKVVVKLFGEADN